MRNDLRKIIGERGEVRTCFLGPQIKRS